MTLTEKILLIAFAIVFTVTFVSGIIDKDDNVDTSYLDD